MVRAVAVILVALVATPAAGATSLSSRAARHALVTKLQRYQDFHAVTASCRRHSAREQRCAWSGRRPDGAWRGRAVVRRLAGGSIDVRITSARRA